MEKDIFNATKSTAALNSLVLDETSSQFSYSHVHPQAFDLNIQNQFMSGYPLCPHLDEQPTAYEYHDRNSESLPVSLNYGYESLLGGSNGRWNLDKFLPLPQLPIKHRLPERSFSLPFRLVENDDPNGWISARNNTNELSLSLATTRPSVVCGAAVAEQCSNMTSSERFGSNQTSSGRFGSDQTSSDVRDISLCFGSFRPVQFSQVTSNSSYLNAVQEIFTEIAKYSVESFDLQSFTTRGGICNGANNVPNFSSCFADEVTNENGRHVKTGHVWQRRDIEAKKLQFLSLLQVVDERYNRCMDEIQMVTSAFHSATELNPQIHARFALHTMSLLYKTLSERISSQILTMTTNPRNECTNEREGSILDTSFIQKQWSLQQLRRKENQLWRPQRGLPERSVSFLRAWMFQNFLHPYPKDTEKHLLAVKSGLTKNQVSNWFINARVRLWKPMIEEMYSELNSKKAQRNEEADVNKGRMDMKIANMIPWAAKVSCSRG